MVSLIERGHLQEVSLRITRRVAASLDAALIVHLQWRGAAIDRLLDEDHAGLVAAVAAVLGKTGWLVESEVTYSIYGERGSFDLLAFHPATRTLLVIEVKTELASIELTLRKMDEKARLGARVARERFGWEARAVSRLLVMADTSTNRRRVDQHKSAP